MQEGRSLWEERGRDPKNPLAAPEPPFRPYRETWQIQFERAFRALGCSADATGAYQRIDALLAGAEAYPETAETLQALRDRYRLAVLSNADESFLQACLARNDLRFDTIISSESAASYKPHPEIFRRACELLQVEPSRILYVGDSPLADILGAKNAGLAVAWVNRSSAERPEHVPAPDLVIPDLRGLIPALTGPRSEN